MKINFNNESSARFAFSFLNWNIRPGVAAARERAFQEEVRRSQPKLTGAEAMLELFVRGVPRGVRQMAKDARENPWIVLGTLVFVVGGSSFLPVRAARWFTRGVMALGLGTSTTFMGLGIYRGVRAWQRDDREGLTQASTQWGVGLTCLLLTVGGIQLGKRLGGTPDSALKWGLVGNVLHSSDEIAAALAFLHGLGRTPPVGVLPLGGERLAYEE